MSVDGRLSALRSATGTATSDGSAWARRFALLAGVALLGAFLQVLYHVTDVVGGVTRLAAVVVVALVAATVAARTLRLGVALAVALVLLAVGLWAYVSEVPSVYLAVLSLQFAADLVSLAFGEMRILSIVRADLWAVTVAPAPVFATWYLVVRRHYELAAWVGGLTVGFFVLTGDASDPVALLGATSVLAVLGFGTLEESGATWDGIRNVGFLLACVVVVTRLARPVTAGVLSAPGSSVLGGGSASTGPSTIETSLLDAPTRVAVRGSISLSPEVRFVVTADQPALWHAGAYDRFTGRGWVRSGEPTGYDGSLSPPPGETERVEQTFEARSVVNTMPAAWKPVEVDPDAASLTRVTSVDGLRPIRSFSNGASYSVTSERPTWTTERLEAVDGDDPDHVRKRYLQLPSSTPDRVGRFAADLTADADSRFAKASRVERWLEANKEYSLEISRPSGNVADAFLFEMDAGYCVYYATTMTAMLRAVDVPARFAVGYTTGQRTDEGRWRVRGFNSHAWVEVFFPGVGWVPFDPTPGDDREAVRQRSLREAQGTASAGGGEDETSSATTPTQSSTATGAGGTPRTDESATGTPTTTRPPETDANVGRVDEHRGAVDPGGAPTSSVDDLDSSAGNRTETDDGGAGRSRRSLFTGLSRDDQVTLAAGFVAVALGVSRFELLRRGSRLIDLHWQPASDSPRRDVERAFDRLETVLARRYRPRRDGETRRTYVEAVQAAGEPDERLERVLEIYERAVFREDVSRERADEARALVTRVVREGSLLG